MLYCFNLIGFILIELLIIVVLLVIMVSFVILNFKQLIECNELQSVVEEFNVMLQYVCSEVVFQRCVISIQVLKDKDWGKGLSIGVLVFGLIVVFLCKYDGFCVVMLIVKEKSVVEYLIFMVNGIFVLLME